MSDELLTMDEIKKRYANEWVLIDEYENNPATLEVLRGKVRWHGTDRKHAHEKLRQLPRPFRCAVLYLGELPKDMIFVL